jgi:hypothetical protein
MAARIAELEACIAKGGSLRFKVSEKGAVSVYGLGRFPVTLYLEQWENLLSHTDELSQFIEANRAHLKIQGRRSAAAASTAAASAPNKPAQSTPT